MGEIADDLINGATCSECSTYFKSNGELGVEHGYPAVCRDCWAVADGAQRRKWKQLGYQRAIFKAIN